MEFLISEDCWEHEECYTNYYVDDIGQVVLKHEDDPWDCDSSAEVIYLFSSFPSQKDLKRVIPNIKKAYFFHLEKHLNRNAQCVCDTGVCTCSNYHKQFYFWDDLFRCAKALEEGYVSGIIKERPGRRGTTHP